MRALVIGGQGFLGSAVAEELLGRGDRVSVLEPRASQAACDETFGPGRVKAIRGDILDPSSLRPAFDAVDEVYHFAGLLGTSELDRDMRGAVAANVVGAINVFDTALSCGVGAVFYPTKPDVWLNTYTITKHAAERFGALFRNYGLPLTSLRYFNAFGPRQRVGKIRKIIPTFAVQALSGRPLTVYGDGEQVVDMIYSADVARLTVDVVRAGYRGEPLDCGRGVRLTVNEVAEAVQAFYGRRVGVRHLPMRRGEDPGSELTARMGPVEELLGPLEFSDWESSLGTTLTWYAEHRSGRSIPADALRA